MKTAYIIDGSTTLSPSINHKQDVYTVFFKGYDEHGALIPIKAKTLYQLQQQTQKQYIEPTPGIYRDLYVSLLKQGYDSIIVIPQERSKSHSYANAQYASRFYSDQVAIIDCDMYELTSSEVVQELTKAEKEMVDSNLVEFDLEDLFEAIKKVLSKVKSMVV